MSHPAGKVAVVTGGGGRGSGGAISARLAADGASVVIVDIDHERGHETAERITASGGSATFFAADVTHPSTVNVLMDFVNAQYGGLDIIVNCASEDPGGLGPFDAWAHLLDVDLVGPALLIRAGIASMRQRGGGVIVNFGSASALPHGGAGAPWPAYDAAKAGIMRLSTALGSLQPEGIRVNCIAAGWIASPPVQSYVDSLSDEQRAARGVPKRLLPPEEVADAVAFLIAEDSLAGRILLLRNDQPHALIAVGDPGYGALEVLTGFEERTRLTTDSM